MRLRTGAEPLANLLGLPEKPERETLPLAPVDQLVALPTPERANRVRASRIALGTQGSAKAPSRQALVIAEAPGDLDRVST